MVTRNGICDFFGNATGIGSSIDSVSAGLNAGNTVPWYRVTILVVDTVPDTGDIVVVIHAIYSSDSGSATGSPRQTSDNRANDSASWSSSSACHCTSHCSTNTTKGRALFGITSRVVIDSMLNIIVCHCVLDLSLGYFPR
jgi:hypothetical protein